MGFSLKSAIGIAQARALPGAAAIATAQRVGGSGGGLGESLAALQALCPAGLFLLLCGGRGASGITRGGWPSSATA